MNSSPSGLGLPAKLVLGTLAVCALAALFWPSGGGPVKEPGGFLLDAHGRPAKLGPMLAPVSLVHFWASWCPPCIKETPDLQKLAQDFGDKKNFAIVMVAVQDTEDKVRGLLGPGADMVLYDPKWEVANRYGTDKLPETYLVVRGTIVKKFVGQTDWNDPALRAQITSYLGTS
ncbi:MAG TPA: TlpA disulfide reductase family protein [Thermoanaerobaculia bacterium]|jgi:thiol-disulfide isomerase/thioredoxin|nr:TlpA disulfide reductase family protein [Thermoanaerobaculia bacterium]